MPFYPIISDDLLVPLQVIRRSLEKDAGYFDHPDCPYPAEIRELFQETASVDLFAENPELDVLDSQIQRVINDLEAFSRTLKSTDHSEKLAYFKTKTSLIEKLIGMRERVLNLKEISEFRNLIMQFLDEICDRDQISDLIQRLDGALGVADLPD